MTGPIRATPVERYMEPADAHDGQAARVVAESDTRRVEFTGVYRRCDTCTAPILDPFPNDWTLTVHPPTDEPIRQFYPVASTLPRAHGLTPHRPDCPAGVRTEPPIAPTPAPAPAPTPVPGRLMIAPIGADPLDAAAFTDVGYLGHDGLTADPGHNPHGAAVAALDVNAGDLVPLFRPASVTVPIPDGQARRIVPIIAPDAAERLRQLFAAAHEQLAAQIRPALRAVAEAFARLRPLVDAVQAYRTRVDRGAKRAVRRGTATTRAIARRNGRRVPKRAARLHRIRAAYRHRR